MKRLRYRTVLLLSGLLVLGSSISPVFAQEKDKKEVKKEITVRVDDDGNVTINGQPAEEGDFTLSDGTRVIVDRKGGRAIIIEDEDGEKKVFRSRMMAPGWDGDENVFILETDDDGEKKVMRHRIRVPEPPHALLGWHPDLDDMDEARLWHMAPGTRAFFDGDFDFDFDFDFQHANPEIMKMEAESRELARRIRGADGSERRDLEQQLSEKLRLIFDKKLEVRQERIQKLQERLEKQQAEVAERQRARTEIIERRKADLLGEDDELEW